MLRDRFFNILRFLHLVDSTKQKSKGEHGYDPLFKVRPLIDHLAAVYPKYYQSSRYLSIDEMMIGTRCRVSFLQCLPKKSTRFGIKVWVNSDAKTGYVLDFQVYTGAGKRDRRIPLSRKVVSWSSIKGKDTAFLLTISTHPLLFFSLYMTLERTALAQYEQTGKVFLRP